MQVSVSVPMPSPPRRDPLGQRRHAGPRAEAQRTGRGHTQHRVVAAHIRYGRAARALWQQQRRGHTTIAPPRRSTQTLRPRRPNATRATSSATRFTVPIIPTIPTIPCARKGRVSSGRGAARGARGAIVAGHAAGAGVGCQKTAPKAGVWTAAAASGGGSGPISPARPGRPTRPCNPSSPFRPFRPSSPARGPSSATSAASARHMAAPAEARRKPLGGRVAKRLPRLDQCRVVQSRGDGGALARRERQGAVAPSSARPRARGRLRRVRGPAPRHRTPVRRTDSTRTAPRARRRGAGAIHRGPGVARVVERGRSHWRGRHAQGVGVRAAAGAAGAGAAGDGRRRLCDRSRRRLAGLLPGCALLSPSLPLRRGREECVLARLHVQRHVVMEIRPDRPRPSPLDLRLLLVQGAFVLVVRGHEGRGVLASHGRVLAK